MTSALLALLAAAPLQIAAVLPSERDAWAGRLASMVAEGRLRVRRTQADTLAPGRRHTRLALLHRGVPVIGAELAVQEDAAGTVSVLGSIFEGITIDVAPRLSPDEALDAAERLTGVALGGRRRPELAVLPHPDGSFRLVYPVRVFTGSDLAILYVDARTGILAWSRSDLQRQAAAPGLGTGVLGDSKKMSVRADGGAFVTDDVLRPPSLVTFDMKGDIFRTLDVLNGTLDLRAADLARDDDNRWTDAAAVDAHTHAGWTYDYFFQRFGRRGLDDRDLEIRSIVHPVRREDASRYSEGIRDLFYLNAFYAGDGLMVYGEGLPADPVDGLVFDYLAGGLDVVAHELTHGVTDFSSGLVYEGESGALNESFSDMMAAGAEFFFHSGGGPPDADYLVGEDVVRPGGVRSMADPAAHGHPDHYSRRYTGPLDGGGVHINSGIPNHVFYRAIEGGVHRTSGLAVAGVGPARRDQIEKVMYRAFVFLMPPRATFATARAATLQSARDLYGAGSDAERALAQAWTAAGVD